MAEMQKDLVLNPNQYAYVLDKTKGNISCWVGPCKTSLSTSDALVHFNKVSKKFEPCSYDDAISLFSCAPENWYIILKNPIDGNKHPTAGTANTTPDSMLIGRKVNITGPATFALYPGQMAKVVKGHTLRSNQYLLARVYEAESANNDQGEMIDADGKKVENTSTNYVNGQILVIKGTEVSFYIPPTGIEVIPVDTSKYIRDAITLERLEYCILKDEDGNKRYVHGPKVVFPKPTETFVQSSKGGYIFKAIELSKISGIYVKVIAEYKDDKGVEHPVGEELFITGNDQMIYYPRPEHAIINYDGKIVHHAIAIPEGEGRYVMNRLTGKIATIKGPAMYLPDPRTEIIVKRKLTAKECKLWYPGNDEVLTYNNALNEKAVEKAIKVSYDAIPTDSYATSITLKNYCTMADIESNASISRGTSYTKPRTITLDNKYDGVVSVNIWAGYAINIISKNGDRKIVCGPQTVLLDYDQTLGIVDINGKPTVYLPIENNIFTTQFSVETKDFVKVSLSISYYVGFDAAHKDKWFDIEDFYTVLGNKASIILRKEAKKYTIEEFYNNYVDIVRNAIIQKVKDKIKIFDKNGMYISDCAVNRIDVAPDIAALLDKQRYELVSKNLELTTAKKSLEVENVLAEAEKKKAEIKKNAKLFKLQSEEEVSRRVFEIECETERRNEAEENAQIKAKKDLQGIYDAIQKAELAREKERVSQRFEAKKADEKLAMDKQAAYATVVKDIMSAISPDLIAAISTGSENELIGNIAHSLSPYVLAGAGESATDVVNKLVRGTPLENTLKQLKS